MKRFVGNSTTIFLAANRTVTNYIWWYPRWIEDDPIHRFQSHNMLIFIIISPWCGVYLRHQVRVERDKEREDPPHQRMNRLKMIFSPPRSVMNTRWHSCMPSGWINCSAGNITQSRDQKTDQPTDQRKKKGTAICRRTHAFWNWDTTGTGTGTEQLNTNSFPTGRSTKLKMSRCRWLMN